MSDAKSRSYNKKYFGMFWVSEQRLIEQVNAICKTNWMTKVEIVELVRKSVEDPNSSSQQVKSINGPANKSNEIIEEVRNIVAALMKRLIALK